MKIELVTPAPAEVHTGNRTTADRWARLLRELGNEVGVRRDWSGAACDLLIALHAKRSFPSIERFREAHPGVAVGAGYGWWQGRIPEQNGETVITRYTLKALLDKLDELMGNQANG